MISGGNFRFRTPVELAANPSRDGRVLVIGSCFAQGISHWSHATMPETGSDYILFNMAGELPETPPQPLEDYKFTLVLLPLRTVIPEGLLWGIEPGDEQSGERAFSDACDRLAALLDGALRYNEASGALTIVGNFLVPQQNHFGRVLPRYDLRNPVYLVERLNQFLEQECRSRKNVFMLDADGISANMGRRFIQDDVLQMTNHGAFLNDWDHQHDQKRLAPPLPIRTILSENTDEYICALWSEADAIYRTVRQVDQVKIAIFDLDDTLWRGVLAEDGVGSPYLTEGWPMGVIEAVKVLKQRGVLLAIVSKNTEQVVVGAWDHIFRGLLSIDDFSVRRINWNSKAENIAEILELTNLLPKSAVFIDDNPVEREVAQAAFPEIRTLGADVYNVRRVLLWAPETQVAVVTEESANRTEMVRGQVDREIQRKKQTRPEFLASLNLRVAARHVDSAEDGAFTRALELINKTNQFNTTGRRWAHEEMLALFARGGRLMTYSAADRFTDYGLVAVAIVEGADIVQFVMSCRVVGLDVEIAAIADASAKIAADGKIAKGRVVATESNVLCRDLFDRAGFTAGGEAQKAIPMPAHIAFSSTDERSFAA